MTSCLYWSTTVVSTFSPKVTVHKLKKLGAALLHRAALMCAVTVVSKAVNNMQINVLPKHCTTYTF